MTNEQREFIEKIAGYVKRFAPEYGIRVCSPIIAQAIIESGWGKSKLAAVYNNYFGLKCGSKWTGPRALLMTAEECDGIAVPAMDAFRAYGSMEEGVRGYFDFIQLDRYKALKDASTPREYLETIQAAGYATNSSYVELTMAIVNQYELTKYDEQEKEEAMTDKDIKICGHGSGRPSIKNLYTYSEERHKKKAPNGERKGVVCVRRHKDMTDELRKQFVSQYDTLIGRNHYSQSLRSYVFKPYSDGRYYSDCSSSGMATMRRIGLYVSPVLLNTAGIYSYPMFETVLVWIKNGHITNPEVLKVGDCILFGGDDPARPHQIGHVEFVYSVPSKAAKNDDQKQPAAGKAKEGKTNEQLAQEVIDGDWGDYPERGEKLTAAGYNARAVQEIVNQVMRGLKYDSEVAQEVIAGKWGNGEERKERLESAGYVYERVQKAVNALLKG